MPPKDAATNVKRDNTTPSCAVCNRRKVKCDRVYPCAPCRKTGLECTYPEAPRKRARRRPPTPPPESESIGGEKPAATEHSSRPELRRTIGDIGYEVVRTNAHAVLAHDLPPVPRSSPSGWHNTSKLFFGSRPNTELLRISLTQIITIGNAYKMHVDPIVKIFHCTDAWTCICNEKGDDLGEEGIDLARGPEQCLVRAVIFVTTVATGGADLMGVGCSAQELIDRTRADAEAALFAADFMRSREIRVLQALLLYLIALQSLGEDETVWTMLGMAIRVASTLGLPQEIGDYASVSRSLSPYQLEWRRRLWWAILALDARITRILGRTGYLSHGFQEIPRPANINDDKLHPSMVSIPEDRSSLTDATYVRYRAMLSDVLPFIYATNAKDTSTGLIDVIDEAERQIEYQFIRHVDKTVPLQLLTFVAGRGYIKRVKLAMYSIYPTTDDTLASTPYSSEAFWLAKESMEIFIELWTSPGLEPWQWHWKNFFGWHTLRILVQEIAKRSTCSKVQEAWKLVKAAAGLVVSALKLGEEKARLVGDLRMLIEAGDVQPSGPPESYAYTAGSVPSIRPGMGSNPHNALFPGINSSFNPDLESANSTSGTKESQGKEFDLKKINWTELDRILNQLGTYMCTSIRFVAFPLLIAWTISSSSSKCLTSTSGMIRCSARKSTARFIRCGILVLSALTLYLPSARSMVEMGTGSCGRPTIIITPPRRRMEGTDAYACGICQLFCSVWKNGSGVQPEHC